jgi:hypothetical protein
MLAHRLLLVALPFAVLLGGGGCEPPKATFQQGQDLSTLILRPTSTTEGIFPDLSVLVDPHNPFADVSFASIDAVHNQHALQFELNATSAQAARFYIWATILARATPDGDGEAQYYTASALKDVFYKQKADPADLPRIHDMAVAAYSKVLTQFDGKAVTYDATGTIAYELLTPSLQAILQLGGMAPSGWILATDTTGAPKAVHQ